MFGRKVISHLLMPTALRLLDYHYLCLWHVKSILAVQKESIQAAPLITSIKVVYKIGQRSCLSLCSDCFVNKKCLQNVMQTCWLKKSNHTSKYIWEKTCLQNKYHFITEDYFVQHKNITIKTVWLNGKLYTKDN